MSFSSVPASFAAAALLLTFVPGLGAEPLSLVSLPGARTLDGPLALASVCGEPDRLAALTGDPLAVRPVGRRGQLGPPRPLDLTPPPAQLRPLRAARNDFGDWLISAGNEVRWLRGSKTRRLAAPPSALIWDVEFLDGRPVAAVTSHRSRDATVPLLLEWRGRAWEPLYAEALDPDAASQPGPRTQHTAAVLAAGSDDTLWVGFAYRHRLLRIDRRGKVELELRVGEGLPELDPAEPDDGSELAAATDRRGGPPAPPKKSVFVNTARRQIDGLAEGPDGSVYLLVARAEGGGSHVLERFDPYTGTLRRTPVALAQPGPVRLAAGEDGLVLAADNGARGAWLLTWGAIAEADWTLVNDVAVGPLPSPSEARQ